MFRLSDKRDYPDLCQLWLEAFGEGEESAEFVFESFAGYEQIYVLEENHTIVCMLCAVPCSLLEKNGIYLYGVATKKSHRGKGLMSSLLEYAEQEELQKGAEFSVLIPQTPGLFAFYRRFGYETQFYRHAFSAFTTALTPPVAERLSVSPVTAGGLNKLRRETASRPFVQLCPKALNAVAEDLTFLKAECFASSLGYAIARKEKDMVVVEELFTQSPQGAFELVHGICQAYGRQQAQGFCGGGCFSDEKAVDFGMIKFLKKPFPIQDAYMSLMLN